MALKSMTGHGIGEAAGSGRKVTVEISSVNRRQFEIRFSTPRNLSGLEPRISEIVHREISRGNINVSVDVVESEAVKAKGIRVDRALAEAYLKELRKIAAGLGVKDDISTRTLAGLPGVVEFASGGESRAIWPLLNKALGIAVKGLKAMRIAEGKTIAEDLGARLKLLGKLLASIKIVAPSVSESFRQVLIERLKQAGAAMEKGDPRLMQEVALYADRCDISEEIVRLESHMKQASGMLGSSEPVGRSMDFLCQEMFREINTIGSKAGNADISRNVIAFKSELESIREQVQNVE